MTKTELFQVRSGVNGNNMWHALVTKLSPPLALRLLRFSLAFIFLWFGALKIAGLSPVVDVLKHSFPLFAQSPFLQLLGLGEVAIAFGLMFDRFAKFTAVIMILHLFGTLSVTLISPHYVFYPMFPALTMAGEFIAKNIVLLTAGLAIVIDR